MKNPAPLQHGLTYHIYNRGVNREPIFRSDANYRYFLDLYTHHVGWLVDTYAYCLLGNHFHFLLRVKDVEDLTGLGSSAAKRTAARDLSGLDGGDVGDKDLTGLGSSAAKRTAAQDLSGLDGGDVGDKDLTGLGSSAAKRTAAQDLSGLDGGDVGDNDLTGLGSSAAKRTTPKTCQVCKTAPPRESTRKT